MTPTTSYSNTNVPFALSAGDGAKTIYAWYKDTAGNVSVTASASIVLDQTAPTNGTLTATPGPGQVALSWAGSSDTGSGLAATNPYKLVFQTGSSPASTCTNGTQLYLGPGASYTHTGLTGGTAYYYRLCATDKAGNISAGAAASAAAQAVLNVQVSTNRASPQAVGTPITVTATASGGVGPYQYKWWLYTGTGWTQLQGWTTSNTYTWTPTTAGSFQLGVWVRNSGNTADTWDVYGTLPFTVTAPPPPTIATFTASPGSPQAAGTPITVTATASGGVGPYQYKWWLYTGTGWTQLQGWTTSNTYTWTPTTAGSFQLGVWVRNSGNTADTWDVYGTLPFVVR